MCAKGDRGVSKRYYWLKLHNDFFDSVRIRKLRSIAGGDTFTIIYLKLLLYSIDKDGVIEYQGVEGTISEELALALSEDAENVGLTLQYLKSVGLAEIVDDALKLPEAIENVGSETATAQRVREYRERQKTLHCNNPVTEVKQLCNVEIEIEKDIEKNKKKEDISYEISKKEKPSRFAPPTLEEVQTYITENNFAIDAQKFIDYYQSNGWMVGKTKMKDWKATVRNWQRREQERFSQTQKKKRKDEDPLGFLPF